MGAAETCCEGRRGGGYCGITFSEPSSVEKCAKPVPPINLGGINASYSGREAPAPAQTITESPPYSARSAMATPKAVTCSERVWSHFEVFRRAEMTLEYQKVAERQNPASMENFIRQLVTSHGGEVLFESMLSSTARWHSEGLSVATFERLLDELRLCEWVARPVFASLGSEESDQGEPPRQSKSELRRLSEASDQSEQPWQDRSSSKASGLSARSPRDRMSARSTRDGMSARSPRDGRAKSFLDWLNDGAQDDDVQSRGSRQERSLSFWYLDGGLHPDGSTSATRAYALSDSAIAALWKSEDINGKCVSFSDL